MISLPQSVSAGKCHPPAALTGRFQPPGKAEVAGAAHTVLLATHYQGHTQSREQLSFGNPGNPQTAWKGEVGALKSILCTPSLACDHGDTQEMEAGSRQQIQKA